MQAAGLEEKGILACVLLGYGEDGGAGIESGDVGGVGEAGGAFGEDAATTADVEVAGRGSWRGDAAGEELVAEGVHEVEEARGTVWIPP